MEKEEQEESELEEEVEDEEEQEEPEEIDSNQFVEFLQPSTSSPVLGQVAIASEARATDLERDLSDTAPTNDNKSKDEGGFKYTSGINQEEPKYIGSEAEIETAIRPSTTDVMGLGKGSDFSQTPEAQFQASPSSRIGEASNIEKYTVPDRVDIDKAGKEDLFERKDIKYKPSR